MPVFSSSTNPQDPIQRVLLDASLLKGFRRRLLANPVEALKERGIAVPDGVKVRVIEESDLSSLTLVVPPFLGRDLEAETLEEIFAGKGATPCTLCTITTIICTWGTTTSIIIATQD